MSADERSDIANAIWLCANHATLIDRDEVTYTPEYLRAAKSQHERWCTEEVRKGAASSVHIDDLISLGPDVICVGELLGIDQSEWSLSLRNFVVGDPGVLIGFIENFATISPADRYILLNELGDGRGLIAPPSLAKDSAGYVVKCAVTSRFPRIAAQSLLADIAMYPKKDLSLTKSGDIATVSGLDALPQKIWACLSTQRGESPFHPEFGTRLAEYFEAFRDSPWVGGLLKLEVIRQSSIPYIDTALRRQYTPLQCIDRVWTVEALAEKPENNELQIRVELDVNGVTGRWSNDILVFMPKPRAVCRRNRHPKPHHDDASWQATY
jgi:hypothetical protein